MPACAGEEALEEFAGHIWKTRRASAAGDVSALEREIDELVYVLYRLTAEEIRIVESSSA